MKSALAETVCSVLEDAVEEALGDSEALAQPLTEEPGLGLELAAQL